jgi:hypothetical protein
MPELNREEVHQILEKLASQQASFRDVGRSSSSPEAAIAAEPGRLIDAAGSLYSLYSIITLALGYKAARAYWDKTDPNRQRVDHLKSIIDEKGKVKGAPTFTDMSKIEQTTSPSRKKRHSVQIQEKKDNRNPASKTVVDDSDPYSQLLAGS